MAFPTLLMVVVEVVSVGLPVESLTVFLDFTDPFFDAVVVDIKSPLVNEGTVKANNARYDTTRKSALQVPSDITFADGSTRLVLWQIFLSEFAVFLRKASQNQCSKRKRTS
jgi:hypothetical protein